MSTQKLTPAQQAAKKQQSVKDAAAALGQFASAVEFVEWLQQNHLLPGEDAMALAEAYAVRFANDRTKVAFKALIA